MNYILFLDVETTINGGDVHGPNPMHPDNKIVMGGHMGCIVEAMSTLDATRVVTTKWLEAADTIARVMNVTLDTEDDTLTIVGHNLAFDMKYLFREAPEIMAMFRDERVMIWDTLVAEYVLNGQDGELSLTLEDTCQRYGIPFVKDPIIIDHFKRGMGADTADQARLEKYLRYDVANLAPLMNKQLIRAREQEQVDLLQVRMKARKALICAEYHGMKVDVNVVIEAMPKLLDEMGKIGANLLLPLACDDGYLTTLDIAKVPQLRTYLYGGMIESVEKVADGLYKNGKIRYKNVKKEHRLPPMIKTGSGCVDEETIQAIMVDTATPLFVATKLGDVLAYRSIQKEVSTYCKSILLHQINGFIYPNINCTVTATGRLSSSKPNIQNIKNGELKAAFVSRYGLEGRLIEIDFSQLEIIALAILSEDTQLLHDILDGVDIHTALFKDMYHREPSKDDRKKFKPRTFALVYGASAKGISINAKIPYSEAKRFISTFYKRYTGVGKWHDRLKEEWKGKGVPVPGKFPLTKFQHRSPTGLLLTYYTSDIFSPTQMVNYPVQSFAADLVQMMVGEVFEYLQRNFPTALLVNVVHDSLVIDAQAHEADQVADCVMRILRDTPYYMKNLLGVDMTPIDRMEVGCTMGTNWRDMKEVTYE